MKQNLLRFTLSFVILVYVFSINVLAEPAYPFPIKYKQSDGTTVTMAMKGDERISWAALNGENGWEYAQYNENGDLKPSGIPSNYRIKKKDWIEKMQDPNVDFKQLQKDFNEYWEGRTDYKGNGYKIFKRWEYINEFRISSDVKKQKSDYVYKTYEKYKKEHPNLKSASGSWTIQGPTSYVGNETGQPSGMGRINAIAFHPSDANTIFVGSPSGGFWKTTNHGDSWTDLSANMPTLGVSSILIDPGFTSNNTIYLGSGDRDSGDAPGMGVFKSTDGGTTWTQMNTGMGNATVGAMLMHPSNPDIIIAATSTGIYKTTNGGASWSLKASGNFKDIKFRPGDPTTVYAVKILTPSEFYRSTDTGDNWTQITAGIPTTEIGSRMVIGVSAANSNYVYLVQIKSSDNTFAGLLRSTDSGTSFSSQSTTPNIFGYQCDGSGTASQATYDLCITVDPSNANTIYVGSINNWKSTDGGVTWTIVSHWVGTDFSSSSCAVSVHADQHCYEWNNGKLYVGNDGGIYYTGDGGSTWPEITNNLAITQIYKIGQSATDADYTLFGCQDNGSSATTDGSTFTTVRGGDGAECLIDYSNTNYCYVSTGGGKIYRSTTGLTGSYGTLIASKNNNGIGDESATFQSPYMLHKTNASIMFAGYENVYRTLSDVTTGTVTWEAISTGETSTCRVLEQSPANVDILYAVRSGSLKRTDNANAAAGSVIWYACDLPGGITPVDIKADPKDENNVFAVAGYKVYKSTDKGASWADISGSLPDLFTNCLAIDKTANEGIYVGNQTYVYYKNADMADWVEFNTGLPKVDIRELEIFYDPVGTNHRLKAATYGRGLWESDLYESGVLNPTDFVANASSDTQIDLSWALAGGNNVMLAYNTTPTFGTPTNGVSYSASSPISGGGTVLYNGSNATFNHISLNPNTTYYYKIWSYDGSTNYSVGATSNAETTVPVADFTVDNTTSCSGSLTVNFTDASTAPYNSWAWDVDNNGTTDYTTQNPSHTYSSPGIYSVKLTINNGAATIIKENLILVMNSDEPVAYNGCALTDHSNLNYGMGISKFVLSNIDNTTPLADAYYNNYTCTNWTSLEQNTTYNITITTGTAYDEGVKVYIDYDGNGTFDEPGENIVTFQKGKGERTLSYTTPSSVPELSKELRLRVISKYDDVPLSACDNGTFGFAEDYTVCFTAPLWNGNTSTDWNVASNWSNNLVPSSTTDVIIPAGCPNYPILTGDVTINDISIQDGGLITINPTASLSVDGTLNNQATNGIKILSDDTGTGSLIANALSGSGTAEIQRYMVANQWHIVAPPVSGQNINGLLTNTANSIAHKTEGDVYGVATYTESINNWGDYFTSATSGNFVNGTGYLMRRQTSDGVVSFSGTLASGTVNVSVTNEGTYGWNCVGNPYPSAIGVTSGATSTNNFLGVNTVILDDSYEALYIWNHETDDYVIINNAGFNNQTGKISWITNYIQSGQGFIVRANAGGSISFTPKMQVHKPTQLFKSGEISWPGIIIKAKHNDELVSTAVAFNDDMTLGLDAGYDAGVYNTGAGFNIYTQLVQSNGVKFALQCLPFNQIERLVIPLGISIPEAGDYEFSIQSENIPAGVIPILNDLSENKQYEFNDSDEKYSVNIGEMVNSFGRFSISFSKNNLSGVTPLDENKINVWFSQGAIHINGSFKEDVQATVYDINGKKLAIKSLSLQGKNTVMFPEVANGVYLVNVQSGVFNKTFKVVAIGN